MNSFNHYAFGAVGQWLYSTVAGISFDPARPGYRRILMQPQPGGGIRWVRAYYHSIHGRIGSSWKVQNRRLTWSIRIPANCSALVTIPTSSLRLVTDSGHPIAGDPGVRYLGGGRGVIRLQVGSGAYHFESAAPIAAGH